MKRRALLAAALSAPTLPALAQGGGWVADRPISLTVPFLAGGSTDIAARVLAERMAPHLGPNARVIVENRAGAGGAVGSEWVRQRPADGFTLLLGTASSHATNPAALPSQTPYDPVKDFTPVAVVGGGPLVVVVPASSPHKTIAELVAEVRARPGALSWATSGVGGVGHLTGEYLKIEVGRMEAEHVPYRGGSAVMEALAKGEVAYSFEVLASSAPHLKDGLSRGLAVTSKERHPLFPEIPTLHETVAPGFDVTTWNVLLAPRGLPAPVLTKLNAAVNAALAEPAVRERLASAGVDPSPATTPESTRAFLEAELAKFRDIVRRAELRLGK
ncbi:Bug family tripartite tricarboxylate transporter substrate binding protein [Roseomonas xinghualingensis]|uniref:Bug family tripartite tricarboxylate transporter substrate binding protein n=1 Tax=Roseomonas xinghualingensis TaxID=2986475 RepID=UPI0021F1B657|nr:tripartite tricarboxylate transporter substrate-binding protein [Roseomonas sp. SXEYE001]MCV4209781.1 tripartite tricarboxylate transporter substrate-binding protein [Roseomonas sp. SXEYE001]